MPCTVSNVAARARSVVHSICVSTALLTVPISAACGVLAGEKTACDGLVYKEFGLTRAEYLPCAGEMIATLDRMGPQVQAMLSGDKKARGQAVESLSELQSLVKKAGGRNMGLESWDDRGLTSLNHKIWSISGQYEECLRYSDYFLAMVAKARSEKERQYILAQCTYPEQSAREASNAYRYLR